MADTSTNRAFTATKPQLKRPLFTKPSWAQEDKSSNSTDFFRRSNQSYAHIAAEAERKRQRRLARKQQERACEDSHLEPADKRRRISSDSDSENGSDHSSIDNTTSARRKQKQDSMPDTGWRVEERKRSLSPPEPRSSPKSLGQRYERELRLKQDRECQKSLPSNIIDLEEEDEDKDEELVELTAVKRSELSPEDDDLTPSDDEFAELARKAREKARRKRLEADVLSPTFGTPTSHTQMDHVDGAKHVHELTPPPAAPDPVVSILITSRITNTAPLIVNRKVSQRLKDVRITWCQRQGFTTDTTASVFLTWRGKRLFDVTTCKSLGIGVDSNGNIVMKGQKDILGEEERQIHMEAMTADILEEYQTLKRREAERENHQGTEPHPEEPPAAEKEPQVRIILKAKGFTDFKLIVKPVSK
ncbi:MAG: hypothetical protein LQ343_005922 [Gyalolechia ehrenbergii]|nr:MAG: hypothetical protein LQ343_005922 [Gyalolechia ehrenbergii]